jgi:N-acetylmuramoyl-L-alanine amidase
MHQTKKAVTRRRQRDMHTIHIPKRILWICLVSAALLLCIAKSAPVLVREGTLEGKIIIVDAGHGGIDPGGNRPGVREKDINLSVALALKEILHNQGAKVILSREQDVDLSNQCDNNKLKARYRRDLAARIELAEESDADLFVSIHANTSDNPRRHGAESFYHAKSAPGKALATAIQAELRASVSALSDAQPADYFVLRRNKIPAALIELGYITNKEECAQLQSPGYQQKLVQAIAAGICRYYRTSQPN